MTGLATTLRQRRRELGSLFVQRPEREFRFAENGHVDEVHLRPTLRSHWLIEEFMLEANRAVAEVLRTAELPLLWRIHEEPDERKVDDLIELLRAFDVQWVRPSRSRAQTTPSSSSACRGSRRRRCSTCWRCDRS